MTVSPLNVPMFLVEVAKNPFSTDGHKDFAKLQCMIRNHCLKIVKFLYEYNGDISVVRVCGVWIEYTGIQFCIAHQVIMNRSTDGAPEVVINLSSIYHWKFDLLERVQPEEECLSRC